MSSEKSLCKFCKTQIKIDMADHIISAQCYLNFKEKLLIGKENYISMDAKKAKKLPTLFTVSGIFRNNEKYFVHPEIISGLEFIKSISTYVYDYDIGKEFYNALLLSKNVRHKLSEKLQHYINAGLHIDVGDYIQESTEDILYSRKYDKELFCAMLLPADGIKVSSDEILYRKVRTIASLNKKRYFGSNKYILSDAGAQRISEVLKKYEI